MRPRIIAAAVYASKVALLAAIYVPVARVGLKLDPVSGFATLVWPATGLSWALGIRGPVTSVRLVEAAVLGVALIAASVFLLGEKPVHPAGAPPEPGGASGVHGCSGGDVSRVGCRHGRATARG